LNYDVPNVIVIQLWNDSQLS